MIAITQGTETVFMLKREQWNLLRQLIGSMNSTDVKRVLTEAGYTDERVISETAEMIYKLAEETDP